MGTSLAEPLRLPLVRRWLDLRGDAAALLTLLLSYGGRVSKDRLRDTVGELVEALVASGLAVEASGGGLVSTFRTLAVDGLAIVADLPGTRPDAVMPPGPTTEALLAILPERIEGAVLDVGTGPGTLALAAARRGGAAVATDVSPRAVAFAAFNAALNGLSVELRTGDLCEPVAGRRFDLLLAQPPYVPRPPDVAPVTFLHGGPRGDELALRLLAALPDVLAANGSAVVRFDMSDDGALMARIDEAVGPDLDLAVLTAPSGSADSLAAAYGALVDPALGARYADLIWSYREHMASVGTHPLHQLLVIARRSDQTARWRAELPLCRLPRREEDVATYVAALDLSVAADNELIAAGVRPAPGSRLALERSLDAVSGAWERSVRTAAGAGSEVSEVGAALFECLAEASSVKAAIKRLEESYGLQPSLVLGAIRHALARGLLVARV